ncbi:MAG: hypothetical protein H6835_08235 [Planctomycetes bacterium]|nr:hypothetical protein [Planctomycetota bacterium]
MSGARVRLALLLAALAGTLPAQSAGDGEDDAEARCLALCEAADEGRFDVEAALAALRSADERLAATAAAIVRHEWPELPRELLEGLEQDRTAMRRMLHELARGPRRSARAWAERQAMPTFGRTLDHRLLALAARGEPLSLADAGLLLEALRAHEVDDGFYLALQLLPQRIADGLVGRLHQDLASGAVEVEQLTFVFDRLSPRGVMALLGLAMSLPVEVAEVLVRDVYEQRPELVRERAAAALDGPTEVEPVWLPYCGPLLDRPARVARVTAMMRDSDDAAVREAAFAALLSGKVVDQATLEVALDVALDGGDDRRGRLLRVLTRAGDAVPAAFLADCLTEANEVAHAAAQALLLRRVMEPELQRRVMALLSDVETAGRSTGLVLVTAVMLLGDADAVAEVWPAVLASSSASELLDRFARRSDPFVTERLVAELADARRAAPLEGDAAARREDQLDQIALLLCARGDRRELERVVRRAASAPASFARRCRLYARPLPPEQSAAVFAMALADDDPERAADLLEWAATDRGEANVARFWQLWQSPPADEESAELLLEVAARALAGTSRRASLIEAVREAWAEGPLPETWSSLPYELLNTCRADDATGVSSEDLRLCAELLVLPPIHDHDGEARRVARWPDGEFGFPLVAAIATRLRAADPEVAAAAFRRVVNEVVTGEAAADRACANISAQRWKVLWRSLAATPELMDAVGIATAPLWQLASSYEQPIGEGPGLWFSARAAEAAGDLVMAESLYRRAGRALLRRPETRQEARWLLGERDVAAGRDPWAELAAAPYRMQLLRARAAGDAVAELRARRLVEEFAGHAREPLADQSRENH